MLGELAIGFDFNVRSWHRADKLTDLKVRYEREADTHDFDLYIFSYIDFLGKQLFS